MVADLLNFMGAYFHDVFVMRFDLWVILGLVAQFFFSNAGRRLRSVAAIGARRTACDHACRTDAEKHESLPRQRPALWSDASHFASILSFTAVPSGGSMFLFVSSLSSDSSFMVRFDWKTVSSVTG